MFHRDATGRLTRIALPGDVALDLTRELDHPLLGRAHAVGATAVSWIDWDRPAEIPVIAAPGALPPGAGGALLNALAIQARRAEVLALRYAGPYNTPALWAALGRSFTTTGTEAAFTAGALERMLRLAREPIAIDFVPAPHEVRAIPGGHTEHRDGRLQRAVIAGVSYVRDGSPARLVDEHAEVWFGDAPYARVASFDRGGALVAGPHPLPPCTAPVIGAEFPAALVAALAELVAEAVPAPLGSFAKSWLSARRLVWADLGARAARATPDGIELHAALWERLAPHGLGRVALALAEAIAPLATAGVLR